VTFVIPGESPGLAAAGVVVTAGIAGIQMRFLAALLAGATADLEPAALEPEV